MRNKVFIILFGLSIVSILAYILLNLGSNTSTIDYLGFSLIVGTYFVFLSLPFLLAYFLGWGKVFSLSILTSLIALLVVTTYLGGIRAGEGWTFVYNTFFALFSVLYLFIASLAIEYNMTLLTLDKDFDQIPNVKKMVITFAGLRRQLKFRYADTQRLLLLL